MQLVTLFFKELIYFTELKNKMYIFLLFFQPFLFLTLIYFISLNREGLDINKYIIATAIISMWSYVLYSSGSSLIVQKWSDTLNLLIASPTSLNKILVIKVLNNAFISLISFILTLVYSKILFNFNLEIEHIIYFLISLFSLLLSLSVVGIILAVVFTAYKNVFEMQNLILYPILILCGVFYPVANFPILIKGFSYLIPMTWSIQSIYSSLEVDSFKPLEIVISLCLSTIYLIISYFIVKKIERKLKIEGTIGAL